MGGTDMTNSVMLSGGSSITGSTGFTGCKVLHEDIAAAAVLAALAASIESGLVPAQLGRAAAVPPEEQQALGQPFGARWTNGFAELAAMTFTFPQSNFNGPDQKVHPFQKSLGCMRWLVQNLTEPGDLVADPFAGSGTTGIAAVQLGRRAHLIEIDATYRDLAEQRLAVFGQATIPTSPAL